jgi:fatty acid desaturase
MKKETIPTIEWQTLSLLAAHYALFCLLCVFYHQLPWWLVIAWGGFSICLHGSLQHEAIHGHPTRSRRLNEWLVFPALGVWLPYEIYRDTHLKHHKDEYITDPFEDPESYFVAHQSWSRLGAVRRVALLIRNTVVGRLVLGPVWACCTLVKAELYKLRNRDFSHVRYWYWHAMSVAALFLWLTLWAIPLVEYIVLVAYPGLALTMLRSFLEHQADPEPAKRTVVVESGRLMGLLYLNNNLHALHHEQPALPWYRLPAEYRRHSDEILVRNGGYFYSGYFAVIWRYLFSPRTHPRHPYV